MIPNLRSNFFRTDWVFRLFVAALCSGAMTVRANDLLYYGLTKSQTYSQSTSGAPVPDFEPFSFYAFVADQSPSANLIVNAEVDFPGGPIPLFTNLFGFFEPGTSVDNAFFVSFPTQTDLETSFPNGDFTFNLTTINDGLTSFPLNLNGDLYPNAPHINNFTAAQSIDSGADFVLRWDPFAGGGTNDLIHVSIYSVSNFLSQTSTFETSFSPGNFSALDGRATSLLIPAGTLQPLTFYYAVIRFRKQVSVSPCPCGLGFAGYESATAFNFVTTTLRRSPSDVFPIAVTGVNEIAYDLAFGGGNYLVAMLGQQDLAANSDHGEVLGVLVGRDGTVLRTVATGHSSGSAAVAFGTTNFLLVWDDEDNIFGQFIGKDGAASGVPFQISNDPFGTEQPAVTFDGNNFLVGWTASDGSGGGDENLPRAQLISPDGTFPAGEIALASGAFDVKVAAGGGKFLAVAVDSDTGSGVYGQFLDSNGTLLGSLINIDRTPYRSSGPKTVFFDATMQRFIVTFEDGTAQDPDSEVNSELFARTVDLNGTVGPRKTIATGASFQGAAHIATDGHSLLFTWVDGIFSSVGTSRARFFDSTLNPLGAEMITFVQHGNKLPFIAPVQFDGSRYLIVNSVVQLLINADSDNDFVNGDAYGRFIMPNAPGIATQPRDQTVAIGANVLFSVEATGPQPITYQWQRNGVNIPGATSAQLTLPAVSSLNAGAFRVLISNSSGTTTSQAAQLAVLQPPTIVQQPQSQLSVSGSADVIFTVVAAGAAPLRYQWRHNGANIPGETSATLLVPGPISIAAQGNYAVVVANAVGATNSVNATLTLSGPSLTWQNSFAARENLPSSSFGSGNNFNATKEQGEPNHAGKPGGSSVWFNWTAPVNGVATFSTVGSSFDTLLAVYTGSTVDTLTSVASDDDSGPLFTSVVNFNVIAGVNYAIAVDGVGAATGNIFLSFVSVSSANTAPVIPLQPSSVTVQPGESASFNVGVSSGTTPLFQWFKDGIALAGETSSTITIGNASTSDVGTYFVRVGNNSSFTVDSALISLELVSSTQVGGSADKLEDAILDRTLVGVPTFAAAKPGPRAGGFTAPSAGTIYTHNLTSTLQIGEPDHGGIIGSASRWFVVQPTANGAFSIDTIGSDFDTVLAVYTGASLAALHLLTQDNDGAPDGVRSRVRFDATNGVDYYIAVDGADGAQGNIVLNYQFGTPPEIVEAPLGKSVIAGSDFSLHIVAVDASGLSYLWKFNGVPIRGATNAELLVANCQSQDQGTYTIEVSNPLGTTARAVSVVVAGANTPPTVVLTAPSPTALLVYPTNIQLSANASGYALTKVEFFQNKKKIGESTSAPYGVNWSPLKAGKYTLTAKVTDGNRRAASSAAVKIIVLQPITIIRQPLPRSVALDKTARFKVVAKGSTPLTYQWLFEGSPVTNALKSSLSIKHVQTNALGNYSVRVTNPAGSVESTPAALTLKP